MKDKNKILFKEYLELYETIFSFSNTKRSDLLVEVIYLLLEYQKLGYLYIDTKDMNKSINNILITEEHIKEIYRNNWHKIKESPLVISSNKIFSKNNYKQLNIILDILEKKNQSENTLLSSGVLTFNNKLDKYQLQAIRLLSTHKVILIDGGPGTGKTSTIINILMNLVKENKSINIGISAPTGKAVKRLKESIDILNLNINEKVLSSKSFMTLHKWLSTKDSISSEIKTLSKLDVFIVDEMSMVDLDIFRDLITRLNYKSTLILVGDKNQLPPIESGSIWNYLINNLNNCGLVRLIKTYRNSGDIRTLSSYIKDNKIKLFINLITNLSEESNVQYTNTSNIELPINIMNSIKKGQLYLLEKTKELQSKIKVSQTYDFSKHNLISGITSQIFNYINNNIILCRTNIGTWGTEEVHKKILGNESLVDLKSCIEGTPILCTKNQDDLGLSNGDIGFIISINKTKKILFNILSEDNEPIISLVDPSISSFFTPALALTIHKAQGSESDNITVLWNEDLKKLLSTKSDISYELKVEHEKQLLYTAITRAKNKLELFSFKDEINN
tara:strand:+ start:644 stop:2323 length:1680 start_codon:yes stop_codon:yes gene_type:complete